MQDDAFRNALPNVLFPDMLLSRPEVKVNFGIPVRFLEVRAVSGGGPPMVKIGRSVRYRVGDLREWIAAHTVTSTSDEVDQ